eukprot:CAMPEP_0175369238 /NCGR_PEP_ID=MMETSP0095-20121207/20589_2 /TAXON_ID=311494 /ORGANISM="Alexandrium monilatum, Strain CCMP3105" /LENGTH=119 /DNA_ID=CAMNT_0016667349 /DNA_START=203 /DNA_END=558 /DNA_ORIENTATION=-
MREGDGGAASLANVWGSTSRSGEGGATGVMGTALALSASPPRTFRTDEGSGRGMRLGFGCSGANIHAGGGCAGCCGALPAGGLSSCGFRGCGSLGGALEVLPASPRTAAFGRGPAGTGT